MFVRAGAASPHSFGTRRKPMFKTILTFAIAFVCAGLALPRLMAADTLGTLGFEASRSVPTEHAIQRGYESQRVARSVKDMHETVHRVPVTVPLWNGKERSGEMIVTAYKPDGRGPFPAIIHHHGTDPAKRAHPRRFRQYWYARHWVKRGFAVFAVTRLGFGDTGLEPFPELIRGPCETPNFETAYRALSNQSRAALRYVRSLPHVDAEAIVLSGQSRGGSTVLAHIGLGEPGVVGGINFAGAYQFNEARGRFDECGRDVVHRLTERFGRQARVPVLWIFGEDDKFSPIDIAEDRFAAFATGGGEGRFLRIRKQAGLNGHYVISRPRLWARDVDAFIGQLGVRLRDIQIAGRGR